VPGTLDPGAYAAWFDTALGQRVWADEMAVLLDLVGDVAGRRVVDAGCGDGRLAAVLAGGGARVVGVDLDPDMLRAAQSRRAAGDGRLHLIRADIERLPLASESADVVVAVTTLCRVADPVAAVRKLGCVLRPGGRLVLGELGRWSVWAAGRRLRALLHGGPWASARFWTKPALIRLLQDAGFSPAATRGAVFYPRSEWLACLFEPLDRTLGTHTTIGAAFIAVLGEKPRSVVAKLVAVKQRDQHLGAIRRECGDHGAPVREPGGIRESRIGPQIEAAAQ